MGKENKEILHWKEERLWQEAKAEGRSLVAQLLGKQIDPEQFAKRWAEERMKGIKDPLTDLYSRGFFDQELPIHLAAAERHSRPLALMMADLDRFKETNDRFGHLAGDEVLRVVGQITKETIRESDVAVRYGGEEIAVVLPETDQGEAVRVAERLRGTVKKSKIRFQGKVIPCTISVGLAVFPYDAKDREGLIRNADKALYAAKDAGRNCVRIFSKIR